MLRLIFHIPVAMIFILLIYTDSYPQSIDRPIFEIEKDRHLNSFNKYLTEYRSDTNINATYYKLDLYITYEPNFLTGAVTINSTSRINNLTNIFYDFSDNMTVDSILYYNDLLVFNHTQNKVFITLNNSFSAGQNISIKIFYHGVPVPTGFGSFIFGSHNNNEPSIWTLSEPYGCIDWYPCKNTPSDKVDSSDVWLRCSDQLIAVSNGLLRVIESNGDGTQIYKWHNSFR
jgi:aminopeptidase N